MLSVDTNVLVRLIAEDDAKQLEAAESFVSQNVWVSHVVLAETIWVLSTAYQRTSSQLARAVEILLSHEHLNLQEPDVVRAALTRFEIKPAIGFTDYLILEIARKAGHVPLGTFDRNLAKIDGTQRL